MRIHNKIVVLVSTMHLLIYVLYYIAYGQLNVLRVMFQTLHQLLLPKDYIDVRVVQISKCIESIYNILLNQTDRKTAVLIYMHTTAARRCVVV